MYNNRILKCKMHKTIIYKLCGPNHNVMLTLPGNHSMNKKCYWTHIVLYLMLYKL